MALRDILLSGSANRQTIIHFPNGEREDIYGGIYSGSMKLNRILCKSSNLKYGECNAASFQAQIADISDLSGVKIYVYQKIGMETVPLFTGIIDSCKAERNKSYRKLVAYDEIYSVGSKNIVSWYNDLFKKNASYTLKQFRDSFFLHIGIEQENTELINDTVTIEKTIETDSLKAGDVMYAICQINACFGNMTPEGKVRYVDLDAGETHDISDNIRNTTSYEEYVTKTIDKLMVLSDKDELNVSVGSGDNTYTIKGNFLIYGYETENLRTVAGRIFQKIRYMSYRPADIKTILSEINIQSGDKIIITDNNISFTTYVLKESFQGAQLLMQTIQAYGQEEYADVINDVNGDIKELKLKQSSILSALQTEYLKAETAELTYLKSTELTTIEADIKNAIIGSLSAEFATVDYLEANYAQLNLANVEKATIGTVLADVGLITEATIVNGHVTGYLDSVNINANSITAGDLSVERLIMRGSENSVVYALNNITGALQAQNVDTINGEVLTQRTVTADRLVAKSITASEIAAGTLTANEINVANIFGNSAVLNTLISQSAFINAVSANSVVVGAGKSAELAKKMANGKLMHNDAMFMNGDNGVAVYNQLHNGNVTVTRVLKSSYNMTSCPTTSNYIIRIQTTGAASPKHGGFVRSFYSRPNAVFIIKYLINLPKGYYLKAASNSMGTGFVDEFIGDTEGAGTWKEYYRMTTCGETGSFSTGGYVYIEGSKTPTSSSPLVWYLGAIYTYDVTDANPIDGWLYQDTTLIDGGKIYTGTVTADAIAANAVTTAKLAANAVTADKLSVSSLSAITANLGTVTAGTIKMKNVEDKTAYITYEDKGGYSNQIGAYGMTLHADRENTSVGAGYMIMQAQYDEAAIVISRYATDYTTDIAPGWGMFSHRLSVGGYNNTAYALSAKSIIAQSIVTESGANLSDINDRLKNLTFYADTATTPSATGSYKAIRTLPSGFTVNNTYIIAIMIQRSDTAAWQAMDGQISAYIADTHLYVYVGNSFWANRPMKILFARR